MLAPSRPADGVASSFPGDAGPGSRPHDARMADVHSAQRELGGFTPRAHPAFGMRPALRFALAVTLTVAYLVFAVSVSHVWRDELEVAIGPVMAWVIPILMAYIPGLVIGFMCFTLILSRYRPPPSDRRRARGRPASGRP